jgi:phosphoribosyl 1,2-cyclic phosphate phosphodiesterase
LSWIERIKPKRAIITNMHIDIDYARLAAELPAGVEPAYDGMTLDVPLG